MTILFFLDGPRVATERRLRKALFWVITWQAVVISYRRDVSVGGGNIDPKDGAGRMSRNVGERLPLLVA